MRAFLAFTLLLCGALVLSAAQTGEKDKDKKEVTLKGKICCAKCELGVETECMTVIVTKDKKDNKKDVTIYFNTDSHKTHHSSICSEAKAGVVTGIVTEDGKKKLVAAKTVKFD